MTRKGKGLHMGRPSAVILHFVRLRILCLQNSSTSEKSPLPELSHGKKSEKKAIGDFCHISIQNSIQPALESEC